MTDITNLRRTMLPNGLEVLLYPSFDAPVASFQVWYRVGSRNELPGITGVSHWVEHMMFKGTPSVPLGQVMVLVNQNGGELNAFTSFDFTAYHETLPADRVQMAVEIEADRMVNLLIDPAETESERTVILSERQMTMNNPTYVLWDETIGSAFRVHSYRNFVIGTEHDLKTMGRDDLYSHYRRYYAPNNAVVVATGAFEADAMLELIERHFGSIPASDLDARPVVTEPNQIGERRVTLRRPAPAPEVLLGYHVPGAGQAETDALELLSAVLSGAGGRMGRSARLPRALVSTGKARSANGNYLKGIDPFLFLVSATGLPDGDVRQLENLLTEQLALIVDGGIGENEMARAQKQLITAFYYGSESISDQANGLGEAAMYGDAADFFAYPDRIGAVSASDVQRVASEYLTETNRTVGHLIPTAEGAGGPQPTVAAMRFGLGGPGAPRLQPFERETLEPGVTLLVQAQPSDPVVAARIRVEAGSMDDPADRHGLSHMTAQMLLRGTPKRSRDAFEEAADQLGASIGVGSGREHTDFNITCLAEDLAECLALVGDAISNATFDHEQIELTRRESVAAIRQAEDKTMAMADHAVRELLFPPHHPRRHRTVGDDQGLAAIVREDLVSFHESRLARSPMTVAVVGGFESTEKMAGLVKSIFGDARRNGGERDPFDAAFPGSLQRASVVVPGKEQADVAIAYPVGGVGATGYYDFKMANAVLGEYGLMGKIGESVRQKQGLAYYAFSTILPGKSQSLWFSRAGVDPANVDRAIESIVAVIEEAMTSGLSDEELDGTRQLLTGQLALQMQTNAGIVELLLAIEEFDLGLEYVDTYPDLLAAVTPERALSALTTSIDLDRIQIGIAGSD